MTEGYLQLSGTKALFRLKDIVFVLLYRAMPDTMAKYCNISFNVNPLSQSDAPNGPYDKVDAAIRVKGMKAKQISLLWDGSVNYEDLC